MKFKIHFIMDTQQDKFSQSSQLEHIKRAELFASSQSTESENTTQYSASQIQSQSESPIEKQLLTEYAEKPKVSTPKYEEEICTDFESLFITRPYTEQEKKQMLKEVGREKISFNLIANQESAAILGFLDYPPFYRQWRDLSDVDLF